MTKPSVDLESQNLTSRDFSRADLFRASLKGVKAPGANFSRSSMTHANLSNSQLSGANFTSAYLDAATIIQSDLEASDFTGASLIRADLRYSSARSASFVDANLTNATLNHVNLDGADFAGARLNGASIAMDQEYTLKNLHLAYGYLSMTKHSPFDTSTRSPNAWFYAPGNILVPTWTTEIKEYLSSGVDPDLAHTIFQEHSHDMEVVKIHQLLKRLTLKRPPGRPLSVVAPSNHPSDPFPPPEKFCQDRCQY